MMSDNPRILALAFETVSNQEQDHSVRVMFSMCALMHELVSMELTLLGSSVSSAKAAISRTLDAISGLWTTMMFTHPTWSER